MIGRTISHYKIESKLGEGGMGEVYLATDLDLDRPVALKFLADVLMRDEDARARFLQEARSASKISHPNVVSVHAIEEVDDAHFIAMEYVKGKTLQSVITEGPLSIPDVCRQIKQIAAGLGVAHGLSIVHRDVKPANVMITESGLAKIMDFGLAQLPEAALVTRPGSVIGTIAYMAPEQLQGLEVDARADVFSLGVVFYELLTGERPFKGDHGPALMYSTVYDDPIPIRDLRPQVAPQLADIVAKALSKSPEGRFADAQSFLRTLDAIDELTTTAERPSAPAIPESPAIRSLAVLYLRNLGQPEDEFLSYGVTEDLIVDLARLGGLRVAPMRSVLPFKDGSAQLDVVARNLNTTLVLDGSIYRSDRMIRIAAQLVDVPDRRTLWANRWEEPAENLPRIKSDLAAGVAHALSIDSASTTPPLSNAEEERNPQAYKAYLRGKYIFEHMKDASDADVALGLFRQAVSDDPTLIEAHVGIGEVLLHHGQYERAIRELNRALSQTKESRRQVEEAAVLKLLSQAHDALGQWDDGLTLAHQALGIARDSGDLASEADALGIIIGILRKQSKHELAIALFQRVVEINRILEDHEKALTALFEIGTIYLNMNDPVRARSLFEEGLGTAQDKGNQSMIARGLTLVGASCFNQGSFSEALQYYTDALEIGERLGDQTRITECTAHIGIIRMVWGEYPEAIRHLRTAVEMAPTAGGRRSEAIDLLPLAWTESIVGKYEQALEHARRSVAIATELNLIDIKTLAMNCIGSILTFRGHHDDAARQFREAITLAERSDVKPLLANSILGLAIVFYHTQASNACIACAERALKVANNPVNEDVKKSGEAYIGSAEVRLGLYDSGIQRLLRSYGEAQKEGHFYGELVMQRLLGEALFHNGPTAEERDRGHRILQNALNSARDKNVPHEIDWIRQILAKATTHQKGLPATAGESPQRK